MPTDASIELNSIPSTNGVGRAKNLDPWIATLSLEEKAELFHSILRELLAFHPAGEPLSIEDDQDKLIALLVPAEVCRLPVGTFLSKVSWWVPDARTGDLRGVDLEETLTTDEVIEYLSCRVAEAAQESELPARS